MKTTDTECKIRDEGRRRGGEDGFLKPGDLGDYIGGGSSGIERDV